MIGSLPLACTCHECGRAISKAKKVYQEKRFCEACYARLFKRKICPACGNFARLPQFDASAVCRTCEVKKPCVRCHRSGLKIGRLTAQGPACVSCAHYFRKPQPCERCATPSTRLVRTQVDDRVLRCCPACQSKMNNACCSACRRPRVIVSADGPALCKRCFELGRVPCPRCDKLMPAGLGNACMACFWDSSFEARRDLLLRKIGDERLRAAMGSFSVWLKARRGAQFAALNMQRYQPFMEALHLHWASLPPYAELVAHFGADTLRRSRSVVIWLTETGMLVVDPEARENSSDQRRINQFLQYFPDGIASDALQAYQRELSGRSVKLRTVRLALGSALRLLQRCDEAGQALPSQRVLRLFLRTRPGLHASLFGFVSCLNRHYGLRLDARFDQRWLAKSANHVAELKLTQLYVMGAGEPTEQKWIRAAITYFHRIKLPSRDLLQYHEETQGDQRGFSVKFKGKVYWVPEGRATGK